MRTGILGGTFDPIHEGHIEMAKTAYNELKLDNVLIMPTGNPPHKSKILDAKYRCEMIKLAIEGIDYLQLSDFELKREGVIYTAMTLQQLCEENPDTQYTFIMGADSFLSITNWFRPDRILRYAGIAVCNRNNVRERVLFTQRNCLLKTFGGIIDILNFDGIDISSHYIRSVIKEAQSDSESINKIIKYINPKVLEYIGKEGLYI